MTDTILVLAGIGIPDYSARGLSQTLTPIDAATSQRRTINGALNDLSVAQFRKYQSTIECTDQQPPACDGVWPGRVVTVDCVAELSYPVGGTPARQVVPGSERTNGNFVIYRPRLVMQVTRFNMAQDEWGRTVPWQMALEEI